MAETPILLVDQLLHRQRVVRRRGVPWSSRVARALLIVGVLAGSLALAAPDPAGAAVRTPFTAAFSSQENGGIVLAGNSQLTCQTAVAECVSARAGIGSGVALNNNNYVMAFRDVDGVAGTTNSTSAELVIPDGSTVLYAHLVWGARRVAGPGGAAAAATISQVKLRTPTSGTAYSTITATRTLQPGLSADPYQASADITAQVQAAGPGTYWVADLAAATGADRYGGWSLAVAYRNPAAPLRDLRIFEGFADVTSAAGNSNVDIPISGFLTPSSGTVNAAVGVVAWEGDRGSTGDALRLNGVQVSDAAHPASNYFNAAISDVGANIATRNPSDVNNFGVDVARVNANGILPNGSTATTLNLTTGGETYYPGLVTTQIDLFTPAFNSVSKTVVNLSGNDPAEVGDTLEYRLTVTNTGADAADNAVLRDALPANATFVPGSILVTVSPGDVNNGPKTDAAGDDIGDYTTGDRTVRVRVGTGATATAGGTLLPDATVSARFRVTVDRPAAGTTIRNTPALDYRARTIGRNYVFTGNTVSTTVQDVADVAVTKTSSPSSQTAGSTVTYTVTATNNGPNAATDVVTTDRLPTGVTFESANPPAGTTCGAVGQVVTCTTPTLANGAAAAIPISVTVTPGSAAGTLTNTVTVSSSTADDVPENNSAVATTQVTRVADLSLEKSGPSTATAGSEITYTLVATNAGPSTATGASITDLLPEGTTYVRSTATTGSCTNVTGSNTVTCNPGNLAPSAQATVTITVRIKGDVTASSITNEATISSTTPDPAATDNTGRATTTVTRQANLDVTKVAAANPITAGTVQSYAIRVTNAGPSDASTVRLLDPVTGGLTVRSATSTVGTCAVNAGDVDCAIGSLAAGATAIVTVRADVPANRDPGPLSNMATASTATADPVPGNNSGTSTVTVATSADLSLVKSATPSEIVNGAPVTYQLTVSNAGPSEARAVAISDPLPSGQTFASSPDGCAATGTVVTCPVGVLDSGASRTVSFTANTPPGGAGDVTNTATVSSSTTDPAASNNTANAVSTTVQRADLSLIKSTAPARPQAGGLITYTLDATNNGPSNASSVTLTDTLPTDITFQSGSVEGGGTCTAAGRDVTCPIGTIAAADTRTVTIVARVGPSVVGTSTNTATVSSSAVNDPSPGNNTASSTTSIEAIVDVTATLTALQATVTAGTDVTYRLDITNAGPATANGVVVTGEVPPGLTPKLGSSGGFCTVSAGTVTCNLGSLRPGVALAIPLVATVNSSTPAGVVDGVAQVRSTTPDSNPANNTDDAQFTVVTSADLRISKTVDGDPLVAGSPVTYTIIVTNDGPSDAVDVDVDDDFVGAVVPGTVTTSLGTCSIAGQNVNCDIPRLSAGGSVTVRVEGRVSASASAPVTNTATVSSPTDDPDATDDSASVTTPVVRRADLQLTKTASSDVVVAGTAVTYTLTLTNPGPSDAVSTRVADVLQGGLRVLTNGLSSTGDACTAPADGASVGCDFGTVPAGGTRTVVISALVPATATPGTVVPNTATVSSPTAGADRSASASFTVATEADLAVTKAPVADPPEAGNEQTYVISAANNGPSTARGVVLTDPLPAGTTFVAALSSSGTCAVASDTVTCALGDLVRGASPTIQITVRLAPGLAGRTLTNTATIASAPTDPGVGETPDPAADNNSSTVSQVVSSRSTLTLAKAVRSGPIVAGENVTYVITVGNDGPSDARNVTVQDPVPVGTTLVSASPSGDGTCGTADPVVCTWATVGVGTTQTVTMVVNVPADTVAGSTISNTASATSEGGGGGVNATSTGTVTTSADLSIAKSATPDRLVPGRDGTYTLVVGNDGPSAAVATTVTDDLPTGITVRAPGVTTTRGRCAVTDGTVACDLGTVADRASVTITIPVTVADDVATPTIQNSAEVDTDTDDPDPANDLSTIETDVTGLADLTVTKTGPAALRAGDPLTWTIDVVNDGPSVARNVVVTDDLPNALLDPEVRSDRGDCDLVAGRVTCAFATIATGAAGVTVTISGQLDPGYSGATIANTARATSPTAEPTPGGDDGRSDTTSSDVATSADVSVVKTATRTPLVPGTEASWTVAVSNAGPSVARNVFLTDEAPAGLSGVTITPPPGVTCGGTTCAIGDLPPGAENALTFTVTGDLAADYGSSTIANKATVESTTLDPVTNNNSSDPPVAVAPSADLSVTKTADRDGAVPGERVSWDLTVNNLGPSVARDVVLSDPLPAGLGDVVVDAPAGVACDDTVVCTIGDLASGTPAAVTVTISATVSPEYDEDDLINAASVDSPTPDPDGTNDSAAAVLPVAASADLSITKTGPTGPTAAGSDIAWTVTVTNGGPSVARTVAVTDTPPAGLTDLTATSSVGTCDGLSCSLGDIDPQASVTITVEGTIDPGYLGASVVNTATVTSDTPDPDSEDRTATATTPTVGRADLSLVKEVTPDPVVPGEQVTFTLTVTNEGPSTARDVSVTDALPPSLLDPVVETEGCELTPGGTGVVCERDALAPDGALVIVITGTLDEDVPAGEVANTASVISSTPDPATTDNTDTVGNPTAPADLGVTKEADVESVLPGGAITWTVTVTNEGPATARNVIVTDQLPEGITVESVTPSVGTCGPARPGSPLVCEIGAVAVDDDVTVTIAATVGVDATGTLANAVSVTSPDEDDPTDNATVVDTPVGAAADLVVTKAVSSGEVVAGGSASWTVTVTNNGPVTAPDVVVTDPLPAGVGAVTLSSDACLLTAEGGPGSPTASTVVCSIDDLAVDASFTVDITVEVDPTFRGTLENTASATSDLPDPTPGDGIATASVPVVVRFGLSVTKVADRTTAAIGEAITYTIEVANAGPSAATGVAVIEELPPGATVHDARVDEGSYDPAGDRWVIGTLAPGGAALSLTISYADAGAADNRVSVLADDLVGPPPVAGATVEVTDPTPGPTDPGADDHADQGAVGASGGPGAGTVQPGSSGLPRTGTPLGRIVAWGLALVVAGAVLRTLTRRARRLRS